jgi:DNA invertase Pin-like site-specific DNA recombinase
MTKTAGIYARISRADNKAPKVENQIALCRALADDHGYEVVSVFEDDGIAASGKAIDDTTISNRPGAQQLLEAMRAGEFDVLLAAEGERLARTYLDGIEFIRASAAGGVTWHLDSDGPLDPATPMGEEIAVSMFASGRREGRVRDARQRRRYDRERAAGMPLWGPRPFGYEDDRVTLRPAEADLIRTAVDDYLAGRRSMLRIAADWTAAGALTDGMNRKRKGRDGVVRDAKKNWTATTVRQVLQRERNAGIMIHDGVPLPVSQIEPIITVEQLEALKARVKTGTPVGARAQTLMGGILRCECGAPMHGTISYSQRKGGTRYTYYNYKCSQTLYDKTRRHASISQETVDSTFHVLVLSDLFKRLLEPPERTDTTEALQRVTERLTANGEALAHLDNIILDVTMKRIHAKAKGEMKTLEAERIELQHQRDALLTHADEQSGLEAVLDQLREQSMDSLEDWTQRLNEEWARIDLSTKQAWIRSRYRPVVQVGGRGMYRITPNPIGEA